MNKKKYDFNVCIECQKQDLGLECDEDCIYLEEMICLNSQRRSSNE